MLGMNEVGRKCAGARQGVFLVYDLVTLYWITLQGLDECLV